MSHETLKSSATKAHLPASQRVGPDDLGYTPSEEAILSQAGSGAEWLCHKCQHGMVVKTENVRGKRAFCTLVRPELRDVVECSRYEAK